MSVTGALTDRGMRKARPGQKPSPPSSGNFLELVQSFSPVGIWPQSDGSGTVFADLVGNAPGEWIAGAPLKGQPSLVTSAADPHGFSTAMDGVADRGRIPHHASHLLAAGTLFVVVQPRNVTAKSIIVARDELAAAGGMSLEIDAGGQPRAYLRDAGNVARILTGSVGAFVAGQAKGYALSWGGAGLKLYLGNSTPVATHATTDGIGGTSTLAVGGWHTGIAKFRGLLGWICLFGGQLSDANVGSLMAEVVNPGVTWANDDAATVTVGQTIFIPLLTNDHFQGADASAGLVLTQQGTKGSFAPQTDRTMRYVAGSVAGPDEGRYTVNGSPPARIIVTVQPSAPTPGPVTLRSHAGSQVVVLYESTYGVGTGSSQYGLRSIESQMTPYAYAPPGQMAGAGTSNDWKYDHSVAGLNAGGDKLGAFAQDRYNQYGQKVVWIDIEQWPSINVPSPLSDGTSFNASNDDKAVNTDYITNRSGVRVECHRMRLATLQRAKAYLAARGLEFIEFADYNFPRKLNITERAVLSTDSRITFEPANFTGYMNALDGVGPQCQMLIRDVDITRIVAGTGSGLTRAECIEWYVNGVRIRRQAFEAAGQPFRAAPAIWPILFSVSTVKNHDAMPAGMMTELLDALYAEGVRRFFTFHWQGITQVWNDTAKRNQAHAANEEMASWCLSKGIVKVG